MSKSLVIVESPAKARTIAGYLGDGYAVESSIGHIRDLPDRASDVPETERKRFGALGVDVEQGFEPYYVVDPDKKKVVTELRKRLKDAEELLLATDEDREGEAIAWHLVEVLKPKVPVRRMVFHEITRDAIQRALGETRDIDDMVDIYSAAWKKGVKTTYYLHMKPRHTAEQSTVKVNKAEAIAGTGAPKKGFGAAAGTSAGSTAGADTGAGAPAEAPAGAPAARKGFGFGGAVKAGE